MADLLPPTTVVGMGPVTGICLNSLNSLQSLALPYSHIQSLINSSPIFPLVYILDILSDSKGFGSYTVSLNIAHVFPAVRRICLYGSPGDAEALFEDQEHWPHLESLQLPFGALGNASPAASHGIPSSAPPQPSPNITRRPLRRLVVDHPSLHGPPRMEILTRMLNIFDPAHLVSLHLRYYYPEDFFIAIQKSLGTLCPNLKHFWMGLGVPLPQVIECISILGAPSHFHIPALRSLTFFISDRTFDKYTEGKFNEAIKQDVARRLKALRIVHVQTPGACFQWKFVWKGEEAGTSATNATYDEVKVVPIDRTDAYLMQLEYDDPVATPSIMQ